MPEFENTSEEKGVPNKLDTDVLVQILSLEAPDDPSTLCATKECRSRALTLYRCDDCFTDELHCGQCTVDAHRVHPFHRLGRWDGHAQLPYFERVTMASLDFEFWLGHDGYPCPSSDHTERSMPISFVDVNGVFKLNTRFCVCPHNLLPLQDDPQGTKTYYKQLLRNQLYPASKIIPETAYSFRLLRHFQRANLSSKTAAYDYCEALKRLTDPVQPQKVLVSPIQQ